MFFIFYTIIGRDALLLSNGNVISKNMRVSLSDDPNSWYFMRIKDKKQIPELEKKLNTEINTAELLSPRWIAIHLNENQVNTVQNEKLGKFFPVRSIDKVDKDFKYEKGLNTYYVYATETFNGTSNSKITKLYKNNFIVETSNVKELVNSPDVLFVTEQPAIQFMNRWSHSYLQTRDRRVYYNKYAEGRRIEGLDGRNTIVTLIDTGVNLSLIHI